MQENKDNEKFLDATKSKVQNVTDLYCSIEDKIKDRITQVQAALYRCQGFNEALDDFERWLYDTESRFQALGMLSIKPSVIKKQGSGLKVTFPYYINLLINGHTRNHWPQFETHILIDNETITFSSTYWVKLCMEMLWVNYTKGVVLWLVWNDTFWVSDYWCLGCWNITFAVFSCVVACEQAHVWSLCLPPHSSLARLTASNLSLPATCAVEGTPVFDHSMKDSQKYFHLFLFIMRSVFR